MTKEELIQEIENIGGVIRAIDVASPVELLNNQTLIQINVYIHTPGPDVNIHVSDNIKTEDIYGGI